VLASLVACGGEDVTTSDPGGGGAAGTGGAAGNPGNPGIEVLYEGEARPYALALDGDDLFWLSDAGLRRAPVNGGEPVTLAAAGGGFGEAVTGLTPAGDYVFYHQASAFVQHGIGRVPRGGGTPQWVADAERPQDVIANAESVFWTDSGDDWDTGRIWRAALDGSEPTAIATGLVSPRSMAIYGDQLYFENGNTVCARLDPGLECVDVGIYRVPITGGEPERVVSNPVGSNPVWKDGAMYWLGGEPSPFEVMLLPPGGAARSIARVVLDSPGDGAPLVSDGAAIYWSTGSRVLRMPFDTQEVKRLVTGLEGTTHLAVRGDWVYEAEAGTGRILRIATDGSAHHPAAEPITGPCPEPAVGAEELALTPRADGNLELLALSLEPERVVASQETYERLVSDVGAIRALEPALSEVEYLGEHAGRSIQLQWTEAAAKAFADGVYTAWDCLNDAYGLTGFSAYEQTIDLALDGNYNLSHVLEQYEQLPGVTSGTYAGGSLDGPTICVLRDGGRHEYVFDDTGGFCPTDCTEHHAYHFSSDAPGQVTALAEWDSTTGDPVPAWFGAVCMFQPRTEL
jgi:hypothetical protein